MRAEIVSVGTEILLGQIVDTNAAILGTLFAELGISHTHRQTVGDNLERLTLALKVALDRSDIVVTIGGLGPTLDDLTRDGIAAALDDQMVLDEAVASQLRALFESRRIPWTTAQDRQAMRPVCAEPIENPNGTAPGLICRKNGKIVIALPGPKQEFGPMVRGPVRDALMQAGGGQVIHSWVMRIAGMGESIVERELGELMHNESPTVAPYAKESEVHLRVTAAAGSVAEADALIEPVVRQIEEKLGHHVYGFGETTLEQSVIEQLTANRLTVATCESCTGGMLAGRLTSVPGSSAAVLGGLITYTNGQKVNLAHVDVGILEEYGPYSQECAMSMAVGARQVLGSDIAVSITGIAGPEGSVGQVREGEEKPVGLVYIGLASDSGVDVKEFRFRGSRESIRNRATQAALVMLRRHLLD